MSDRPGPPAGQKPLLDDPTPRGPATPYPLAAFERRGAALRAAKGSGGGLVLPWHSSPRHELGHELSHELGHELSHELGHELEQPASHTATHGALALWPEIPAVEEPQTAADPRSQEARRSILLAEDDARLARVVQSALELEGEAQWSVTVASDGARALALAATSPPHVVLLDVLLPGVDGAEVYRRLRANPATRQARVIFVSAATSLDLYERGIRDGVLLRKPFDVRDLVRLVRELLAQ